MWDGGWGQEIKHMAGKRTEENTHMFEKVSKMAGNCVAAWNGQQKLNMKILGI